MPAAANLVTSTTTTLGALMHAHAFRVPVNQRPWAWGKPQVIRFLDDLTETTTQYFQPDDDGVWKVLPGAASRQPHFLGAFVFYQAQTAQAELEIVDGQQRLTLATVLAAACLEHLGSLQLDDATDLHLRHTLTKRIRRWTEITGLVSRVSLDSQYNQFYREYCLIAQSNKDRAKVIKPVAPTGMTIFKREHPSLYDLRRAADLCRKRLADDMANFDDQARLSYLDALEKTLDKHMQCLAVTVTDYAHGLAIFRSLNSTGLGLSDSDNLKNELFRRSARKDADILRQAYFDTLLALPARDMTGFLRLRYVSRFGLIARQDVYDSEVNTELKHGADMKAVVGQWQADAQLIKRFHESDPGFTEEIRRDLDAIRKLEVTYPWSMLLAAAHRFLPGETKNFRKCVGLAKDFSFRMLTVRARDVLPLDQGFAEACEMLRSGKQVAAVRNALRKRSTDTAFVDDFSRYVEKRSRVQYYVLWELERVASNNSGLVPAPYATTVDIEHVLPQHFDSVGEWTQWREPNGAPLSSHADHVSRLGNLLILEKDINSKMNAGEFVPKCTGNYPPALLTLSDGTPRPSYLDSSLALPKLLAGKGYTAWDEPTIDLWQKDLATLALKAWPLDWT